MKRIRGMTTFSILALITAGIVSSLSAQEDNAYAGSNACGMCHSGVKKAWEGHGHSMMLRAAAGGAAAKAANVSLPGGRGWNDFSYLVGGARTYARFIDSKGYVVTGPQAQWSMDGKAFTPFRADVAPGTSKYDCIKCHTVGWRESGAYEGGVENKLEGIPGAWFENSVGCEACHGMGHQHVILKNKADVKKANGDVKKANGDLKIIRDGSFEACGKCHKRTEDNSLLLVGKDLVESRQQYTEIKLGWKGRTKMTCTSCHNPHASASTGEGTVRQCTECHSKRQVKIPAMAKLACIDCHMPVVDRGAYDEPVQGFHRGDMRSHLFGITPDPAYVLDGGNGKAALNPKGVARLTVEMACGECHLSGKSSARSRDKLLEEVKRVHRGS
ncbi:MAG: multiheme c-type cytochrome [Candidatus Latescibacterota bacterium]